MKRTLLLTLCFFSFSALIYGQLNQIEDHYHKLEEKHSSDPVTLKFVQAEDGLVPDYSKLSQIILLRHGEPALDKKSARHRKEAKAFIEAYDTVGIYPPSFIPLEIGDDELKVIFTSSLNRSRHTARLVLNRPDLEHPHPVFREFERQIIGFPNFKMPIKFWLSLSRGTWFLGLNDGKVENFGQARARAEYGAEFLAKHATKHGKAVLVSHGLLNHFLVSNLEKLGWTEVFDGGSGYLSQKMLVKYND